MFYFCEIDGKKILKSDAAKDFEDKAEIFFTTKEICIKTKEEDFIKTAKANRTRVLGYLRIEEKKLFTLEQTHGTNVEICTENSAGSEIQTDSKDLANDNKNHLKNTDGVILTAPETAAILNFADCTPVALYDPQNNVIAGLHAGWRGTAGEIAKKGIRILREKFNSNPEKIIAIIGPCIAFLDFETGIEVYHALKKTVNNDENLFKFNNDKVFCDLAKINKRQLEEQGVKTIDISPFKTTTNNNLFYSYRLENKTTNRISMVLKLKAI